jgi:hypothetical protein
MEIKNEKYIILPCSGTLQLGIPRGHLYVVRDREKNELGFATKEAAFRKYGKKNCFISGSDTLCPICFEYNNETLTKILEFPLNLIEE